MDEHARWVPVSKLNDEIMVKAAASRANVRLRNGTKGILVRWPSERSTHNVGRKARIATEKGTAFSIPCAQVRQVRIVTTGLVY